MHLISNDDKNKRDKEFIILTQGSVFGQECLYDIPTCYKAVVKNSNEMTEVYEIKKTVFLQRKNLF